MGSSPFLSAHSHRRDLGFAVLLHRFLAAAGSLDSEPVTLWAPDAVFAFALPPSFLSSSPRHVMPERLIEAAPAWKPQPAGTG
jgi:hypothetical protein